MRRPKFSRWIRVEILRIADMKRFSLRKLAARSQEKGNEDLAAALLLYAHENDCTERLMGFVYDDALREEYQKVERHLGSRDVERLALRGTPMMSLPVRYRDILEAYERAYYTPERIAAEKREIGERAREAALRAGTSPTELARMLGVDRANLSAFISRGETHRLNLDVARQLAEYAGDDLRSLKTAS